MNLKYIKTADPKIGEAELINLINTNLKTKKVLWIVSGGSNTKITASVMGQIDKELSSNLFMMLSDERYGSEGHIDSNYKQLIDTGFDAKDATFYRTLIDDQSISQTISRIGQCFRRALEFCDLVIGQLGVGEDGHIAGVLPNSPVVNLISDIVYFDSAPYKRISLSLEALKLIDISYVFCYGKNKRNALESIRNPDLDINLIPAKVLLESKEAYIFNDQIGDE